MIDLRAGTASATIAPDRGGRVAPLVADGTDLVVTGSAGDHDMLWGSFPMAPWAGRVAGARFRHDGADHVLVANLPPDAPTAPSSTGRGAMGCPPAASWHRPHHRATIAS